MFGMWKDCKVWVRDGQGTPCRVVFLVLQVISLRICLSCRGYVSIL